MKLAMQLVILASVVGFVFVAGCSSRGTPITIINRSGTAIENIVVSGSGFSEHIGAMPDGSDRTLSVHPQGESGLRVVFVASGRSVDSGEQGYFEAGGDYVVKATISPDFKVTFDSNVKR